MGRFRSGKGVNQPLVDALERILIVRYRHHLRPPRYLNWQNVGSPAKSLCKHRARVKSWVVTSRGDDGSRRAPLDPKKRRVARGLRYHNAVVSSRSRSTSFTIAHVSRSQ